MDLQEEIYQQLIGFTPQGWFQQARERQGRAFELLFALAGAIADAVTDIQQAEKEVIPRTATGIWLDFHLEGIGLTPGPTDTDERDRLRYRREFEVTRNVRGGDGPEDVPGITPLFQEASLQPVLPIFDDRDGTLIFSFVSPSTDWQTVPLLQQSRLPYERLSAGVLPLLQFKYDFIERNRSVFWDYFTPLPLDGNYNTGRPLWERRIFIIGDRLPRAFTAFYGVTIAQWATSRDALRRVHQQARDIIDSPGLLYVAIRDGLQPDFFYRAQVDIFVPGFGWELEVNGAVYEPVGLWPVDGNGNAIVADGPVPAALIVEFVVIVESNFVANGFTLRNSGETVAVEAGAIDLEFREALTVLFSVSNSGVGSIANISAPVFDYFTPIYDPATNDRRTYETPVFVSEARLPGDTSILYTGPQATFDASRPRLEAAVAERQRDRRSLSGSLFADFTS